MQTDEFLTLFIDFNISLFKTFLNNIDMSNYVFYTLWLDNNQLKGQFNKKKIYFICRIFKYAFILRVFKIQLVIRWH